MSASHYVKLTGYFPTMEDFKEQYFRCVAVAVKEGQETVDVVITTMFPDESFGFIMVQIKKRVQTVLKDFTKFQEKLAKFAKDHNLKGARMLGIFMELGAGNVRPRVECMDLSHGAHPNIVTMYLVGCSSAIYPIRDIEDELGQMIRIDKNPDEYRPIVTKEWRALLAQRALSNSE
jgi:hypothetical protein